MLGSILAFTLLFAGEQTTDLDVGRRMFESQCSVCHGLKGGGGRGPSLNRPKLNKAPDEAALQSLIRNGSEGQMPGAWQLSEREIASVAAYVRSLGSVAAEPLPGDPRRGAKVYADQGCAGCHIVAGQGRAFGPELTSIGARRSAAHLRESLTRPAAFVPEEYAWVEATTSSGDTIRGVRANEDTFTIQVKDAGGRFHSLRKDVLKELRVSRSESGMPPYERLKPDDLDDLVSYLAGLRGEQ